MTGRPFYCAADPAACPPGLNFHTILPGGNGRGAPDFTEIFPRAREGVDDPATSAE